MHKTLSKCLTAILLFGGLILAACGARQTPTKDPQAVLTEAAATVVVQLTQSAALTPSPAPSNTPEPTATMPEPTAAVDEPPALPTEPAATSTSAPPQAPDQAAADSAGFVADVSIPDNTPIEPGASFRKTWRIKNTGKTTWTTNYTLVYIDGERMNAPDRVSMPNEVKPGEEVEISVDLTAPDKPGTYKAFFRLRNANGQFFHLDGSGDLWVQIVVGSQATAEPTAESTPTPEQ